MATPTAITQGVHHVGLTVPELAATRRFFTDALGFYQVGEVPDYPAVFLSDGVITVTLWQAQDPAAAIPFDRCQGIGLHHLALKVADLDTAYDQLKSRADVAIEFAPEPLGGGPTRHLMCAIPGGIRLELIQPADS